MIAQILLDGSNILFWQGGQAQADIPHRVVAALQARRFAPVVYFDHSIRRHMRRDLFDVLAAQAEVHIAPRGTQADELLLSACGRGRIQIVSNDRFQSWRAAYPHLRKEWLVTGSVGKGGQVQFSKKLRPAPL